LRLYSAVIFKVPKEAIIELKKGYIREKWGQFIRRAPFTQCGNILKRAVFKVSHNTAIRK
jgi:hypothetical protein